MAAIFLLLALLLNSHVAHAQCTTMSATDYDRILATLSPSDAGSGSSSYDYVAKFISQGDCGEGINSLLDKYSGCLTTTLKDVFPTAKTAIHSALDRQFTPQGVTDQVITKAAQLWAEDWSISFLVQESLCKYRQYPTCPQASGLGAFAGINACLWGNQSLVRGQTREEYFAGNHDIYGCTERLGVSTFCTQFATSQLCPATFRQVVQYVYTDQVHSCEQAFQGAQDVEARCVRTWGDTYAYYCPPVTTTLRDQLLLGFGIPVGLILLVVGVFCCVRHKSQLISHQEVLSDLEKMEGSMSNIQYHPELNQVMEQTSKYRGLKFDVQNGMWVCVGTGQRFAKEKEAAQAAYLFSVNHQQQQNSPGGGQQKQLRKLPSQQSAVSSAVSSSSLVSSGSLTGPASLPPSAFLVASETNEAAERAWIRDETEEEKLERRIKQLVGFYEYWDADRQDIKGHVENLFKRHNFTNVSRAVMTKFGVLPPGWEHEQQ